MILIAVLMVSSVHYPGFKHVDWTTRVKFRSFILVIVVVSIIVMVREVGIAILFLSYIFYGIYLDWRKRVKERKTEKEDVANNPVNN
jgi:CDP-diacylglycerol--serine O-phosphatidyltransferase